MKKFLLITVVALFSSFSFNSFGQNCTLDGIANLVITPAATPTDIAGPNRCIYVFNAEFDIQSNGGFKFLFFHTWVAGDYPNPVIGYCGGNVADPGTALQLGTAVDDPGFSFLDIGFIDLNSIPFVIGTPVDATSNIALTYPHDGSVILINPTNSPGMTATLTKTSASLLHFKIENIKIIVQGTCGTPLVTKSDIWGSNQASPDPKAQCSICGISESFNDPLITITKNCTTYPFSYKVDLTTTSPPPGYNITYKVYMDRDDDGIEEPGGDDGAPVATVGPFLFNSSNSPYTSGNVNLTGADAYSHSGMYVQLTAPEFVNTISTAITDPICLVFPVNLLSFTATRDQMNVNLKWETAQEENNYGFDIERLVGSGGWEKIGFVPSLGKGGSSHTTLTYEYTDVNNKVRGISQYRLKQIDIDRRSTYSTIRAVQGLEQGFKTLVYPNPSYDGKVNVLFDEENGVRNIVLVDINGRTVRQWRGVTTNNLQMENLTPGFYSLRILNTKTNKQTVEKFIINKR